MSKDYNKTVNLPSTDFPMRANLPQREPEIKAKWDNEKLYETLCTREEMAKAEDLGDFFCIPADNRDLNYGKYFTNGDVKTSELEDYNSHNTRRLTIEEVKEKLLSLEYIREELAIGRG